MRDFVNEASPAPADDGIVTLLSRVVSDAEQVARAEIGLQKAKLFAKIGAAKAGVVFILAAAVLGLLALIGLVVGVLMILAPLVGPIWATVIVVGVLLVLAAILGMMGIARFKAMFAGPGDAA
jgi:hypothetical protein